LALALGLYNTLKVTVLRPGESPELEIVGEGATALASGAENLTLVAMRRLATAYGRELPPLAIRMCNAVPLGRGLGSSAAAIAAGLVAASAVLGVDDDPASLLRVALTLEAHPDNVAAALWGGFTIGALHAAGALVHRISPPPDLRAVLLIPDQCSSTAESRTLLPATTLRGDAIFNASRVALLAAAFAESRFDLLGVAMDDRLHQPYRSEGFPYLTAAIDAARQAGAHGAALSGAGTSVIALASSHFGQIERAFSEVALGYGLTARTCVLPIDPRGTRRCTPAA